MSVVKVDQKWVIELDSGIDLSAAAPLKIHYRDPEGTTGELTATPKGTDSQVAVADFTEELNGKFGEWRFETEAVIGGDTYYGTTFTQIITDHFK